MCLRPIKAIYMYENSYKKKIKIVKGSVKKYDALLPCNKCINCRKNKQMEWITRMKIEEKNPINTNNYFITLTYNNEKIYKKETMNYKTGEVRKRNSLYRRDITLFMKRLRKYYKYHYDHEGIKYFIAGEYGDKTKRPHYHAIIYNLPIYDLEEINKLHTSKNLYRSKTIEKIWNKGYISIGTVTEESIGYTTKYILKAKRDLYWKNWYQYHGINEEFIATSKRPAIGKWYLDKNIKEIYQKDKIKVISNKELIEITPVKYYDRKYKESHWTRERRLDKLKDIRKEYIETKIRDEMEKRNIEMIRIQNEKKEDNIKQQRKLKEKI